MFFRDVGKVGKNQIVFVPFKAGPHTTVSSQWLNTLNAGNVIKVHKFKTLKCLFQICLSSVADPDPGSGAL
jgi:hypothetical protein